MEAEYCSETLGHTPYIIRCNNMQVQLRLLLWCRVAVVIVVVVIVILLVVALIK